MTRYVRYTVIMKRTDMFQSSVSNDGVFSVVKRHCSPLQLLVDCTRVGGGGIGSQCWVVAGLKGRNQGSGAD